MTTHRCSLDPDARAARLRAFSELLSGGGTEVLPDGRRRMSLDLAPEAHERLVALVAAEAECCPWLELTVVRTPEGKTLFESPLLA